MAGADNMSFPYYLLMPFLAAFVFASASLSFKRAFEEGAKLRSAFLINNVLVGLVFVPGLFFTNEPLHWKAILYPALVGVIFFVGTLASFLSILAGDVSLATPLMGSKVTFVGILAGLLFHRQFTPWQWLAAGMTTLGVFLLGATDIHARGNIGRTTLLALGTAFVFALCDVCIQAWAGSVNVWTFLAIMFLTVAILSVMAYPFCVRGSDRIVPSSRKWLALGAAGAVLQSSLVAGSIAWSRDAAGVNVVYSTRGLWSIILVWFAGHWFGSRERERGQGKMLWRTLGAILMTAAVFVTFGKSR